MSRRHVQDAAKAQDAAAAALGRHVGDDELCAVEAAHQYQTAAEMARRLRVLERKFAAAGGRGVKLADAIDEYRIALAARSVLV